MAGIPCIVHAQAGQQSREKRTWQYSWRFGASKDSSSGNVTTDITRHTPAEDISESLVLSPLLRYRCLDGFTYYFVHSILYHLFKVLLSHLAARTCLTHYARCSNCSAVWQCLASTFPRTTVLGRPKHGHCPARSNDCKAIYSVTHGRTRYAYRRSAFRWPTPRLATTEERTCIASRSTIEPSDERQRHGPCCRTTWG